VRAHPPRLMFGTANVQNRGIPEEKLEMGDGSLEERATGLERTFGRRPEVKAVIGDPASALQQAADESEEPTLTVVGSRGLGAVRRFTLGSVSTDVLGAVAGPVLVVPSPKGVTPKSILPAKTVPATDGAVEANGRSSHRRG
jgi:nucleotide-binding universal stress UspA family protein